MASNSYPLGPCPQCCKGDCKCGPDFWKATACEGTPVDTDCHTKFCCVIDFDYTKLPGGGLQPMGTGFGIWAACPNPEQKLPTKITFPMWCYYEKGSGGGYLNARFFTSSPTFLCYPNVGSYNPGGNSDLALNFHTQCFNFNFTAGDFDNTQFFDLQIPIEGGVWYTLRGKWFDPLKPTNIFKIKQCNPLIIEGVMNNPGHNIAYMPTTNCDEFWKTPFPNDQIIGIAGYYPGGNYAGQITPCSVSGLGLNIYNCSVSSGNMLWPRVPMKITIKEWDSTCVEGREYNGKVAHWWCTPAGCVQAVDAPTDKTAGPFNTRDDCQAGCGTAVSLKWYCTPTGCVKTEAPPTNATSGPHDTLQICEASCSNVPPTPDPFWCVSGTCVQSATQPPGSTGPFTTLANCTAGCLPPPAAKWWCIYGVLVKMDDGTSPHPDATGPFNSTIEANCGPAEMVWHCASTGPARISKWEAVQRGFPYYATEAETIAAGCTLKWYCTPTGCGDFTSPPVGTISGPHATESDCQSFCDQTATPYYCVPSPTGGLNQCVQSATPPLNAVSGPYKNSQQCFENCNLTVDPLHSRRHSSPSPPPPTPAELRRVTIPCIHLGDNIEDPATCGCGTAVLRKCGVHGQCRKTGYPKAGESICLTCPDYQSP